MPTHPEPRGAAVQGDGAPTILGRYSVHAAIAGGGMATVHLGRQVGAGGFARIVAIKRLHPQYARHPDFVAMFLDEARLVARVRHPNVVQTLDVVATGGELFVVMEYVHGESFSRVLDRHPHLPPRIAAAVVAGALHGLHAAHVAESETGERLHVVHRDVSPQNVLVGMDGVARIIDFGVAKARQRVQTTREGQLKGKLPYMAPEQIQSGPVDARTDVYAAAVMLWEALTGTRLFDADNDGAIVAKVLSEEVSPPSRLAPHVTPALDAIVMRGLARDPSQRFADAAEMAIALEATGIASPSEVAAWMAANTSDSLRMRAELIARIEVEGAATSMDHAKDTVERLSAPNVGPARPEIDWSIGTPTARMSKEAMESFGVGPEPSSSQAPSTTAAVVSEPVPRSLSSEKRGTGAVAVAAILGGAALVVAGLGVLGWLGLKRFSREADVAPATATTPASADAASVAPASARPSDAPAASASGSANAAPSCPPEMVLVPGGKFFMGSDEDLPNEKPAHQVTLSPYCIDRREVTVAEYVACSAKGECKRASTVNEWDGISASDHASFDPECNVRDPNGRGKHPVNCVEWASAVRFCEHLGKRLPTEAEWEFAARGSDGRKYPWGDAEPSSEHLNACGTECVAWGKKHRAAETAMYQADDGYPTTAPVGSFPKGRSPFGLDDMTGNVWEWVADRYAPYDAGDVRDPTGPGEGNERVIRGGAWNGAFASWVRPTFRYKQRAGMRSYGIGFRCAAPLR